MSTLFIVWGIIYTRGESSVDSAPNLKWLVVIILTFLLVFAVILIFWNVVCVEYTLDTDHVQKNIFKMNQWLTVTLKEPRRIIIVWNSGTVGFVVYWTDASRSQNDFLSFASVLIRFLWMHLTDFLLCIIVLLYIGCSEGTMLVQCHIAFLETRQPSRIVYFQSTSFTLLIIKVRHVKPVMLLQVVLAPLHPERHFIRIEALIDALYKRPFLRLSEKWNDGKTTGVIICSATVLQ